MTRGTLAVVYNRKVYRSIEFNGSMSPDDLGEEAMEKLKYVTDLKSFKDMIADFKAEHFNEYTDDPLVVKGNLYTLDLTSNYTLNWFSDYLYIMNLDEKQRKIKYVSKHLKTGKCFSYLETGELGVFYFGRLVEFRAKSETVGGLV